MSSLNSEKIWASRGSLVWLVSDGQSHALDGMFPFDMSSHGVHLGFWLRLKEWVSSIPGSVWIILLVATLFRFYGIRYGNPLTSIIADEQYASMYLIRISQGMPFWNTETSPYPVTMTLVQLPVFLLNVFVLAITNGLFSLAHFREYLILEGSSSLVLAGRITSALSGVALLLVFWKLLERLRIGKSVALIGVAYVAFSLIQVNASHWGKPHQLMALFFVLSALYSFPKKEAFSLRDWYLSVLFSAFAMSTHVIGVMAVIWPALSWLLWNREKRWTQIVKALGLGVATCLVLYGLNAGGVISMFRTALGLHQGTGAVAEALPPSSFVERIGYVFRDWLSIEPYAALFIFGCILAGLIFFRKRDTRFFQLTIAFSWIYLFSITVFAMPHVIRWMLLPTLSLVLIGLYVLDAAKPSRVLVNVFLVAMIAGQSIGTIAWLVRGIAPPTVALARDWVMRHVSPDVRLVTQDLSLDILLAPEAALAQQEYDQKIGRGMSARTQAMTVYAGTRDRWSIQTLYQAPCPLSIEQVWGAEYVLLSSANGPVNPSCIPEVDEWVLEQTFYPTSSPTVFGKSTVDQNPLSIKEVLRFERSGPYLSLYRRESLR